MSIERSQNHDYQFWLGLSVIAAVLFSLSGLVPALRSQYTIQDDARQHVFWMQQFSNSELFQNDLIAEYFRSVSPFGFQSLYRLIASFVIDIWWFNQISSLLIGVATTVYCFAVSYLIFPVAIAGFWSSLLLNQNLWLLDDLASGTPRAFIYLLLLAFIYYLLKDRVIACILVLVFQGLFYPQAVLISGFILGFRLVFTSNNHQLEFLGLVTASIILISYGLQTSEFTPVISAQAAKVLPEFAAGGRSTFFSDNWVKFWLIGRRSGFFPVEWPYSLMCTYGLALWWLISYPQKFPLVKKISPKIIIIPQLLLVSSCLYLLAHLLLFRLHLPGRYTHHSIRICLALLDGITITIISQAIIEFSQKFLTTKLFNSRLGKSLLFGLLLITLLYPTYAAQSYPQRLGYVTGEATQLYQFLQQQPVDTLVVTLSNEADLIPSLAQRSVLTAAEYSIPYHQGYYQKIRQRIKATITAQYSPDSKLIKQFINRYQPDLWLLDHNAFTGEYLLNNPWLQQFNPVTQQALNQLETQSNSFLAQNSDRCKVWQDAQHSLLDAKCLLQID